MSSDQSQLEFKWAEPKKMWRSYCCETERDGQNSSMSMYVSAARVKLMLPAARPGGVDDEAPPTHPLLRSRLSLEGDEVE